MLAQHDLDSLNARGTPSHRTHRMCCDFGRRRLQAEALEVGRGIRAGAGEDPLPTVGDKQHVAGGGSAGYGTKRWSWASWTACPAWRSCSSATSRRRRPNAVRGAQSEILVKWMEHQRRNRPCQLLNPLRLSDKGRQRARDQLAVGLRHRRDPGTPAPRHPGTPAPRHPGTPAPRHPGTPAPRHPGTPAPRHPV